MSDLERRYTPVPVELRADKERQSIGGYAAVFNRQSKNLGGFVEQIDVEAFNKSMSHGWPDVRARYNHEILLGTTRAGTLRLQIDGTGLLYDVDPPNARSDILELVARGDVSQSSFAFRTWDDAWDVNDQGTPLRTLRSVELVDVAPVDDPAYADTSVGITRANRTLEALRSLATKMSADIEEIRELAEHNELRSLFVRTDNRGPKKVKAVSGASARMALLARETDPYV
jgi:HK97 family phage prohead protease